MLRSIFILLGILILLAPARADEPWSGDWKVSWPGGGAYVSLSQRGADVQGAYRNGRGKIVGMAKELQLDGEIIHDGVRDGFHASLDRGRDSFSGYTSGGEWLSGLRVRAGNPMGRLQSVDLRTPRSALRSFLDAGNLARNGDPQALAAAVDAVEFGPGTEWVSRDEKFSAAEKLFDAIDLATFSLSAIPEEAPAPRIEVELPRLDAPAPIQLDMARDAAGDWRIVMPDAQALSRMAGDSAAHPADAFRDLQSPRDTLRTFLDGMARWDKGGDQIAVTTIDLSGVPEVLKNEQGRLMAQYLVRIIDRVGRMPLQSVPNSGASREPFVYFEHPAGQVSIEPVGKGADTRWKFSASGAQDLRRLFAAVETLPEQHTLDPQLVPFSPTFAIRDLVKVHAPALLTDIAGRGRIEYWQLLASLAVLAAMAIIALVVKRITAWVLERPSLKHHAGHPRRLAWAIGAVLALVAGSQFMPLLGLPVATRQYTVPVMGSLFLMILTYAIWELIGIVSSALESATDRSETQIDNILLTFTRGLARLLLVAAAGLALGHLWSVPTTGILAGLGIGGLALAFASKETLANVFGAGILLGDRPFRKGDRIIAGDVNGWVESVGLRSTRIRTLYDSLLVVPNGKLADTTIDNLGARRRRTLTTTFLVTSGSTPEKLEAFARAISSRISTDPFFDRATEVNIIGITAAGIQIEVSTSLNTRRGVESRAATHRLYLDILRMANDEGLTLGRGMEKNPVYVIQEM